MWSLFQIFLVICKKTIKNIVSNNKYVKLWTLDFLPFTPSDSPFVPWGQCVHTLYIPCSGGCLWHLIPAPISRCSSLILILISLPTHTKINTISSVQVYTWICNSVVQEIFAVKIFCRWALPRKIKTREISSATNTFNS